MYCYVVKGPVFRLQRGSAKLPIAPSNFSPLCPSLSKQFDFVMNTIKIAHDNIVA